MDADGLNRNELYYPVIFTMPDELRGLWLAHVWAMTNLLFATGHETLDALLGDAKYLGACPGLIAALYTWSQTVVLHPHLHGVVTGGGLTDAGQWQPVRHGFLLPARVVMVVCRGKLLAAANAAVRRGTLTRPDGMPLRPWAILRNKLGRQKGNVCSRER
jgi:Putative transposase